MTKKPKKDDDPLYKRARTDARRDERRAHYAAKTETLRREGHKQSARPILRGERRRHVVESILDNLRDWRFSPFEHEGNFRSGLRAGFCLDGFEWERSDLEAEGLIADAMRVIGARRPTWEAGQREHVTPPEACSWCGRPLVDRLERNARRYRFCDEECALAAYRWREAETTIEASKMHLAALATIRRGKSTPRSCARPGCPEKFRSVDPTQVYCSRECSAEARRQHPNPLRKCEGCDKRFRSADPQARFHSAKCMHKHGWRPKLLTNCEWCGGAFLAKFETARFCSSSHQQMAAMFRRGAWIPKSISPPVFDQVFRLAA